MTLTVGSLFSGIGGFDLGLERAGMKVIWQSEIDEFASKVLKKHWPDVPNLGDITKVDWTNIERPDVICGGYPCQPFSTAGKRGGADDPRHLWPAMFNAICLLRPRYALMENVRGHLSLGFGRVLGDLAEIGYDAEWQVIPAAAVGAPHKRDRVFIVAYPKSEFSNGSNDNPQIGLEFQSLSKFRNDGRSQSLANTNDTGNRTPGCRIDDNGSSQIKKGSNIAQSEFGGHGANMANTDRRRRKQCKPKTKSVSGISSSSKRNSTEMADPDGKRLEGQRAKQQTTRASGESAEMADTNGEQLGQRGRTKDIGSKNRVWSNNSRPETTDGFRQWWEIEPNVGRVANGVPNRVDRLKGLGNAIVPQVAELVGALVVEHSQN